MHFSVQIKSPSDGFEIAVEEGKHFNPEFDGIVISVSSN